MPSKNALLSPQLPLAVRKQLVLTRIAVDRVEFIQAAGEFRQRTHPARLARRLLFGSAAGVLQPAAWVRLFALTRHYPYLSSVLGTVVPLLLRRKTVRGLLSRLVKAGAVGGMVYGLLRFGRNAARSSGPGAG